LKYVVLKPCKISDILRKHRPDEVGKQLFIIFIRRELEAGRLSKRERLAKDDFIRDRH
jgi:hypothetical protein